MLEMVKICRGVDGNLRVCAIKCTHTHTQTHPHRHTHRCKLTYTLALSHPNSRTETAI